MRLEIRSVDCVPASLTIQPEDTAIPATLKKGQNFLDPESEKEGLFGYQQAFSKEMIKELYGTLAHYREMAEKNTKEQVTKGFVCREDAAELVEIAVELAKKRGLE